MMISDYSDRRVAIVGIGRMGSSIVDFLIAQGITVTAITRSAEQADRLNKKWQNQINREVKYGVVDQADAIEKTGLFTASSSLLNLVDADVVIESVNEDIGLKLDVISAIQQHTRADAIIASNSSSILPEEMANAGVDISRVVGLHFFFPVAVSNIVELVTHPKLDEEIHRRVKVFVDRLGLIWIEQNRRNAFLLNMLSMAVGGEAFRGASKFGFAKVNELSKSELFPLGAFSLFDHVGIPVVLEATERYFKRDPLKNKNSYEELMRYMQQMSKSDSMSMLSFFELEQPDDLAGWKSDEPELGESADEFSQRLLFLHINTCFNAVENGLIGKKELDQSIISIMGTKTGPIRLAEQIGFEKIKGILEKYYLETGAQYYRPSSMLE